MSLTSETMVLRSCNADKILLTLSSGAQRYGGSTKASKFDEFPDLIKSEPISFGVHKPRLRCPEESQTSHCSNKMSQNNPIPKKKKSKRNSKLNDSYETVVECRKPQCSTKSASQISKEDSLNCTAHTTTVHSDPLLRCRSESLTVVAHSCPVTDVCVVDADDDEGFAEPVALVEQSDSSSASSGSSSGSATSQPPAIMVHETTAASACNGSANHSGCPSERCRLDSNSDSSVGMAVFGSPDVVSMVPHPWPGTTQQIPSDNEPATDSPPCFAKLPFCHRSPNDTDDEEDDMEGTDLLHLISNSLDRFNAIVHPDEELSSSTSGVGTSLDGADPLLSGSRSLDDFPLNAECAQKNRSDQSSHLLGKSAEVKFSGSVASSWLQYSVSCPTETRPGELDNPLSSVRPRLLSSTLDTTPPVGSHRSARPALLPVEAEDYLRELGAIANKENPQNLPNILHLPSSFCALASTLLDPDSSHVTAQVKETTTTCSLDNLALTAQPKDTTTTIPPPGFSAPNWTELLLTRTHAKDEDNNSPVRRRESVLTALQDPAIRTHESSWFAFSGRSPDWTRPVDGKTTAAPSRSTHADGLGFDPLPPGLVDRADSHTAQSFVRPLLASCGRSRLLSSCLCSEQDSKHGASTGSSGLDPCSNRYTELFNSDWNVSTLPKEFAESLRFLVPISSSSSSAVGGTGQHRSSGSSDESRNGHASSASTATPIPLTRLLAGASAGRQHGAPKLPSVKPLNGTKPQQEKMRSTPGSHPRRYNPTEATPLVPGSFGRPADYSFFRAQRHASLSCSANHNNTRHTSSGARSGNGNPHTGPDSSVEGSTGAKPTVAKWRRACSFYLRGHCKKEDCEFAHDLTKVTCKFWEMGECFKGATCPFLHGYPPELTEVQP